MTSPSASTGRITAPSPARRTASCSTAETIRRPATARAITVAIASLAPLVNSTVPRQPVRSAIFARAASNAARAARPSACGEDGFAQ